MTDDISTEELRLPIPWGYVAAKAWGRQSKKNVLVVHGLLDNAGSFDRLIPLLPRDYYFICIDLPGHGLSSHLSAGISLDYFQYILVIRKVLEYLKWQRYIYMGHSFGALLGLIYCTLYPEGTEKLISLDFDTAIPVSNDQLIGTVRFAHDYILKVDKHEEAAVRLYTKEQVMHIFTHLRFNPLTNAAAEAMMIRYVTKVGNKYKLNHDPRLKTGLFPILNNDQYVAILKQLKTPVLVIMSTDTSLTGNVSPQSAKVNRESKENRFATVEGNHDVHINYPERVAPHVTQFLGNLQSTL